MAVAAVVAGENRRANRSPGYSGLGGVVGRLFGETTPQKKLVSGRRGRAGCGRLTVRLGVGYDCVAMRVSVDRVYHMFRVGLASALRAD